MKKGRIGEKEGREGEKVIQALREWSKTGGAEEKGRNGRITNGRKGRQKVKRGGIGKRDEVPAGKH